MILIKAGMVLGTVMVIAALSSAAPGFNWPKCQSDNGATCAANGCWIDESTRFKDAPPATGGQVEVVLFPEGRMLNLCIPNAQNHPYTCTMDQTTCVGSRYVSVYPSPGTECQENNPNPPPSTLTWLNDDGKTFDTCH